MRDSKRIPAFCAKLMIAWHKCPDMRFGQLMVNVFGEKDPFYIEDDEAIEMIEKWVVENVREVE